MKGIVVTAKILLVGLPAVAIFFCFLLVTHRLARVRMGSNV